MSKKPLVEFPFKGDNQDAPFLLFEIPEKNSPKYLYVASADFYKQEKTATTDSVCTVGIYKYPVFGDKTAKQLVASYAGRPKTYKELNDKILILLEYYNAVIFPENEDLGVFQTYLESLRLDEQYLVKHIDFNSTLKYSENDSRKWGWTSRQSKNRLLAMYANYLDENIKIENEQGQEVIVKRVQTIKDIWLLSELLSYTDAGNFDRVLGHIGNIGFLHFLEKNYIYPKISYRKSEQEKPKLQEPKKLNFFRQPQQTRNKFFRSR